MSHPFTCVHCGALRPSTGRYCKQCGRPFLVIQVTPRPTNINTARTRRLTAAPGPTVVTAPSPRAKAGGARWRQQKAFLLALWLVVTAVLLWATLGRDDEPVEAAVPQPTATPAPARDQPEAAPPDVEKVYRTRLTGPDGEVLGDFDIVLLSKRYAWVPGSRTLVKGLGDISRDGAGALSPQLRARIAAAPEVIGIGTADQRPLKAKNQSAEERRAADRSSTLSDLATKLRGGDEQSVFRVNFGQWSGPVLGDDSYDDQRRVIIVEVRNRSPKLDMAVGLRRALEEHQAEQRIFFHLLNYYSLSGNFEVL